MFLAVAGDFLFANDDNGGFVYRIDLTAAAPAAVAVAGNGQFSTFDGRTFADADWVTVMPWPAPAVS